MPKSKKTYNCDGYEFKSQEELEFYHWLCEAKEYGFIENFAYEPKSYDLSPKQTIKVVKKLKTKEKIVEKHLFHPHEYTPDFIFTIGEKWPLLKGKDKLVDSNDGMVIDVKGTFQQHDGSRSFSINQKWVYEKYGIYVNKLIPKKFFKITWVPEKCRYTPKQGKLKSAYAKCETLLEKFGK